MTDNRSDLNKGRREKSLWIVKILGLMIVMISFQSSCSYLRPASLDYDKNIEPRPSGDIGNIVLLDRYVLIPGQGIDTEVGKIVKAGGLSIGYSIGEPEGDIEDHCGLTQECLWRRTQRIRNHEVVIALASNRTLIATFPDLHAVFYAKDENEEQIAEFLLMVLTFS